MEDLWHSNLDVEFVAAALQLGGVFKEEERQEFAATFIRGYVARPGVLRMYPRGSSREAKGVPPVFGWARLASQEESLRISNKTLSAGSVRLQRNETRGKLQEGAELTGCSCS